MAYLVVLSAIVVISLWFIIFDPSAIEEKFGMTHPKMSEVQGNIHHTSNINTSTVLPESNIANSEEKEVNITKSSVIRTINDIENRLGSREANVWYLREHESSPDGNPYFTFESTSKGLKISSGTSSMGEGIAFIILPKDFLNEKTIEINWNGYFTYSDRYIGSVVVLDARLERNQYLPDKADVARAYRSHTLMRYHADQYGWSGWKVEKNEVNLDDFNGDSVTLAIIAGDGWVYQKVKLLVRDLMILDGNIPLILFDFKNGKVVMEENDTTEDFGYYILSEYRS